MSGVAACLYVRNAEYDIQEWIAYHYLIGVRAFLIYDNGSTDATVAQAQVMALVTDVRVIPWGEATGLRAQVESYEDCFRRFKNDFEWILVIDSDEFLASSEKLPIERLLAKRFFVAGIALNWACFGSSGHVNVPTELTTEAFTRRSDESFGPNLHTKLIVRPELVREVVNPHYFKMDGPIVRMDGQVVDWQALGITKTVDLSGWCVNHYFVRSYAQWEAKLSRGYRDVTRDKDLFTTYDRNEVLDQTAAAQAGSVRALLEQVFFGKRIEI